MIMWPFTNSDIVVEGARITDSHDLADIHQDAFPRGWTADEFVRLMESDNVRVMKCKRPATFFRPKSSRPKGFVLTRVAANEAEILTIAVAKEARGFGLGKALMRAVIDDLYADRIDSLFLEVDENNIKAISLYKSLDFIEVGERKSYYATKTHNKNAAPQRPRALVMRCDLR